MGIMNVTGVGRITHDLDMRKTPNGKSVLNFQMAYDTGFGDNKKSNFIEVVAWGSLAETIATYMNKGSQIAVSGRLETDTYEKDGVKFKKVEIVAENVQFLDSKNKQQNDFVPQDNNSDLLSELEISDDEIPF